MVCLLWETGGVKIELMILKRKLGFFHHLFNLEESALAFKIATLQETLSFPGLIQDCRKALIKLGLGSCDPKKYSKWAWKKTISKAIFEENKRQLLESSKKYKKINYEELKLEEFGLKNYFRTLTLTEARVKFAVITQQLRSVRMNQMNNADYARLSWCCVHCALAGQLSPDSQAHITWCPSYQYLREGKNLQDDKDLVAYFRSVLQLRDALENQ